ncbi:hypothetical protein OG21DRAFT_1504869 [Imleria badia]|nr:hypothetical protein OG21DRAFT_1504869 [Imleria badia]
MEESDTVSHGPTTSTNPVGIALSPGGSVVQDTIQTVQQPSLDHPQPPPGLGYDSNQAMTHGQSLPTHTDDGRPILFHVRALYDYSATIDEEFDFHAGDIIAVIDTPADGWWRGALLDVTRRQAGRYVFPSNYVSPYSPLQSNNINTGMRRSPSPARVQSPPLTQTHTDDGRPILFYVKARYGYSATTDEEFDFQARDIIAVTDTPADGWWNGELLDITRRLAGRFVFPSNYVSPYSPLQSDHINTGMGQSPSLARIQSLLPMGTYTDDGRPILFHVTALYDYSATIDEEFDFQAGDIIAVTDAPEDGWWSGELTDFARREAGRHVFPSNFVRVL